MSLDVFNGSAYVDAKDVQVNTGGSTWVQAKKVKVYSGTAWVLAWVPKIPTVTVSLSKTPVLEDEDFTVTATLSIPSPEGTKVTVEVVGGNSWELTPVEGSTTVQMTAHHGSAGTFSWKATATNLGGVTASAAVNQTVTAPVVTHYHEIVPSGGNANTIQAAMNRAYNWYIKNKTGPVNFNDEDTFACVELVANGTYNLGGSSLYARRGVRLVGAGSAGTRPEIICGGSHFMKVDNHGGGGWNSPHYDWMVHNLWINCASTSGGFSIVHTKRYQISNCYFFAMGGFAHYIECNSSGGPRSDGTYNVILKGNEFTNATNVPGRRVEDECVQLDYSWDGAASNTANDGTVTNNVLIENNNFHDAPRAIGSHHFEAQDHPDNFHANILIRNNAFTNIDPSQYNGGDAPNGSGSEGAVRAYAWENVQILNNTFTSCFQPICLYIPADAPTTYGNPKYFRIAGNYLRNVTQDRPAIYGTSAHSSLDLEQVLVEDNIADGTWDTSPDIYFAGFEDTSGNFSGSTYGCIIRNNKFAPTNMSAAEEKAYNKYRLENNTNLTGVQIVGNTVSDGTVDNS